MPQKTKVGLEESKRKNNMPIVKTKSGVKHYPYTKKGREAAKRARIKGAFR